jgi:eukaryotic-like serine/threonine-protein kinase
VSPERWQQVERAFEEAQACAASEREALLRQLCGADAELRREVESLLAAAVRPGEFLDQPALDDAAPLLAEPEPADMTGTTVGPFQVERRLGTGGMGEVYLAHDRRLQRAVALKVLDPALGADRQWRGRFLREARLAAALDHPHICTVHEVGEEDNRPFIAMQYVEGRTLQQVVGGRALELSTMLPLALQVADALSTAHERGVIHRDVKSANVMVDARGQAKVLDFGIARLLESEGTQLDTGITSTGAVLGTPGSMSPEQACGGVTDARSDIFSFGVLLYEMATGRPPFAGASRAQVMHALMSAPHVPARELNPTLPASLSTLIDRALAKQPAQRPQTMREVMAELQRVATEAGTERAPWSLLRWGRGGRLAAALFALAALAAVAAAGRARRPSSEGTGGGRGGPPPIHTIAVLPFKSVLTEGRDEALEMGIADTLIARLSGLRQVKVRSISAVRRYASPEADALAAGREQQVDAVLEGHIQKGDQKVRMTVRLLRVADQELLWTDQFDAPATDLFGVQDAIAQQVARALAVRLSAEDEALLVRRHTQDPEAYRLYLLGRLHWSKRTRDSLERSISHFKQALERDDSYALAWTGLASSYAVANWYGLLTSDQSFPQAKASAQRALELDDTLADAHAVLGYVEQNYEWDWAGSEAAYRRALQLDPNSATAHHWYGMHLVFRGRGDEGIDHVRQARELDPLSLTINQALGGVLSFTGRYDEAIAQYDRVLEMEPGLGVAQIERATALCHLGREEEALAGWLEGEKRNGLGATELAALQEGYRQAGIRGFWRAELDLVTRRPRSGRVPAFHLAAFAAAAGDTEQAFSWLERAYRERDDALDMLKVEPLFHQEMRADPRFSDLLRRVGLS